MEKFANTDNQAVMLRVTIKGNGKTRLAIYDPYHANTFYHDREEDISGTQQYYMRLPVSPKTVKIYSSAEILNVERKALDRKFDINNIQNYMVKSFALFAQEFCQKCGYLKSNYSYESDDGIFHIMYVDEIVDVVEKNGVKKYFKSTTPCRINKVTGIIQVNATRFRNMTVPMRFALLLHEYCHVYKNVNPKDEEESDKNSLFIYLGLGYPRYEAYLAWVETFDRSTKGNQPDEGHKARLAKIKNIIDNFDKTFQTISFI